MMIHLGFIGTSKIADQFADAIRQTEGICAAAVFSRTEASGTAFAQKHQIERTFTSLEAMASDTAIDAVYIASPNSCHASQALCMLSHKKHVLCEKPMAVTLSDLQKLMKAADENGVILLEAMRPAFDPAYEAVAKHLPEIGTIRRLSLSFCQFSSRYDNFKKGIIANVFNPEMGGGALLDIGIYPVHMLAKLMGRPKAVYCAPVLLHNGIDGLGSLTAVYDGAVADISYSKITNSFLPSHIEGENGYMMIDKVSEPSKVWIHFNDGHEEIVYQSKCDNNMIYEAAEFARLIEGGSGLSEYQKDSITAMEIIDMALNHILA